MQKREFRCRTRVFYYERRGQTFFFAQTCERERITCERCAICTSLMLQKEKKEMGRFTFWAKKEKTHHENIARKSGDGSRRLIFLFVVRWGISSSRIASHFFFWSRDIPSAHSDTVKFSCVKKAKKLCNLIKNSRTCAATRSNESCNEQFCDDIVLFRWLYSSLKENACL